MRANRALLVALAIGLIWAGHAPAQLADLVLDWTKGRSELHSSATPYDVHRIGDRAVFWTGQSRDSTLWTTDGTEEGTFPLLRPCLSDIDCSQRLVAEMNGAVFFQRSGGLIFTDGTVAGTGLLPDEELRRVRHVANRERTVYFAWDFIRPDRSDTLRMIAVDGEVDTLTFAADGLGRPEILSLVPLDGREALVHVEDQSTFEDQLWHTDGTTAVPLSPVDLEGFPLVALFSTATNPVLAYYGPSGLQLRRSTPEQPVGELIFEDPEGSFGFASFAGSPDWLVTTVILDNGPRYSLLISGGTADTTHFLPAGWPALLNGVVAGDQFLVERRTRDSTTIQRVDLPTGTVTDLPELCSSVCGVSFHRSDDRALIYVEEDGSGRLWRVGPDTGPVLLRELTGTFNVARDEVVLVSGFTDQLLVSDGTDAGTFTRPIDGTGTNGTGSRLGSATLVVSDFPTGFSIYPDDGGPPRHIRALASRELGSEFPLLAAFEDRLLAATPTDTPELVTITGGAEPQVATALLSDLGCEPRSFHEATRLFVLVLCASTEPVTPPFLLRTDGTPAGTMKLVDLPEGTSIERTIGLESWAALNFGTSLWGTDGTVEGTEALASSVFGFDTLHPIKDLLFFDTFGIDSIQTTRSDGAAEGTVSIADVDAAGSGAALIGGTVLDGSTILAFDDQRIAELSADGTTVARFLRSLPAPNLEILGAVQGRLLLAGEIDDPLLSFDPITGWIQVLSTRSPLTSAHSLSISTSEVHYFTEEVALLTLTAPFDVGTLWRTDGHSIEPVQWQSTAIEFPSEFRRGVGQLDGHVVFSGKTALGRELMAIDLSESASEARLLHDVYPGPDSAQVESLRSTDTHLFFLADDGIHGRELFALDTTTALSGSCAQSTNPRALCLQNERFRTEVSYRTQEGLAEATATPLESDTGSFWFFDRDNLEMMVKVIDGTAINGNYWTFLGALTDVEFDLTIADAQSGRSRRYHSPGGRFASFGDIDSLAESSRAELFDAASESADAVTSARSRDDSPSPCDPSSSLCLLDGRFAVSAVWRDFDGKQGTGRPRPATDDTGAFWFFDAQNLELLVKVLDARAINGNYWVYFGSLSNVGFDLEVLDTATGETVTYSNPTGEFASRGDVDAFPSIP